VQVGGDRLEVGVELAVELPVLLEHVAHLPLIAAAPVLGPDHRGGHVGGAQRGRDPADVVGAVERVEPGREREGGRKRRTAEVRGEA
jgi:hypothetical protein